jgi:small subunit ribosomal protein S17
MKSEKSKIVRKQQSGKIVSDKMTQTAVIELVVWKTNRLLDKRYRQTKKVKAHNPDNIYHLGDWVMIKETRPISRDKHWIITGKKLSGEESQATTSEITKTKKATSKKQLTKEQS